METRDYLLMNILKHSINSCRFPSFFGRCHLRKVQMKMESHRRYKQLQIQQSDLSQRADLMEMDRGVGGGSENPQCFSLLESAPLLNFIFSFFSLIPLKSQFVAL